VARVKNRMDPDYDAAPSAGYRCAPLILHYECMHTHTSMYLCMFTCTQTRARAHTHTQCRNVALNLRIVNGEARRLGIEMHVAEVQLLLRSFAELKVCRGRGLEKERKTETETKPQRRRRCMSP
jgi:hypothetical protein